ncbi:MAG: hypothetical protein IT583_05070 [Verrucomicrobia bacterium]|nr:hypothetical protein [Verrucomicrobiota bacterium]
MDRFHKRTFFSGMPPLRAVGFLALMGFVLFVSFRIFTPPVKTVQILASPDSVREARLQHVYYYSKPGFKIAVRDHRLWHTVFYLSEYTNAPAGILKENLRWSPDSEKIYFDINDKPVWGYDFETQSSRLRSP